MPDYLDRIISASMKEEKPHIWKCIDIDEQGRYWITDTGDIISVCRNIPHKKELSNNGNNYFQVYINGKYYYYHRLYALALEDVTKELNYERYKIPCDVHHLDFNRKNNSLDNLCILPEEKHNTIHSLYRKLKRMEDDL